MKKYSILFLFSVILQSCNIQYDGETKLEISGKLADKNGESLSGKNISINIIGGSNSFDSGPTQDLISYGTSDNDGKFTLLVPSPLNENEITIKIENSDFLVKEILSKKNNFINFKLDLKTVLLSRNTEISRLKIILNQVSTNKQISDIKIEGLQYQSLIDLNNDITINQNYNFTDFEVFKNQTVILKYKIQDSTTNTMENFSENIVITNDLTEFTITI